MWALARFYGCAPKKSFGVFSQFFACFPKQPNSDAHVHKSINECMSWLPHYTVFTAARFWMYPSSVFVRPSVRLSVCLSASSILDPIFPCVKKLYLYVLRLRRGRFLSDNIPPSTPAPACFGCIRLRNSHSAG